jgi:hypothetical protein
MMYSFLNERVERPDPNLQGTLRNWIFADGSMFHLFLCPPDRPEQTAVTLLGSIDRDRGIFQGRRAVRMNPDDMQEHGRKGEILDITSHF